MYYGYMTLPYKTSPYMDNPVQRTTPYKDYPVQDYPVQGQPRTRTTPYKTSPYKTTPYKDFPVQWTSPYNGQPRTMLIKIKIPVQGFYSVMSRAEVFKFFFAIEGLHNFLHAHFFVLNRIQSTPISFSFHQIFFDISVVFGNTEDFQL